MVMRGGTSKGAFFVASDLPEEPAARDDLLLRIMGSPDERQIDGLGGAHPLTSKVAIVGPTDDERADIEYLFLQVGVGAATVSDRQNCGNLLAGVGQFAVERGLVRAEGSSASVRVLMRNTGSIAISTFGIHEGMPVYEGATSIAGVPGTASPVELEFAETAGSSCGSLLPTGHNVDVIDGIECTLVDNGMPVVVVSAAAVGVLGTESPAELEANASLVDRLESLRLAAGELMNLGDVSETTIPKMTMVSAPTFGGAINTRTFIPHRCHEAIGVFGAVSVATAAKLPGSPAHTVTQNVGNDTLGIEHPTGIFEAVLSMENGAVARAGIVRTARKLMDGTVFARSVEKRDL